MLIIRSITVGFLLSLSPPPPPRLLAASINAGLFQGTGICKPFANTPQAATTASSCSCSLHVTGGFEVNPPTLLGGNHRGQAAGAMDIFI